MKTITIKDSTILIGESYCNVKQYLTGRKHVVVITDQEIQRLYGDFFAEFPAIILEQGEPYKTLSSVEKIIRQLLEYGADRNTFLLGVGGGIVCDITGFAASIYMRGISFGFISTTLLSQVDASIGGKNGVNFDRYKNIVGTFTQPEFVICDMEMLKTLPIREFKAGFSEIIKVAIIANHQLLKDLHQHTHLYLQHNPDKLEYAIYEALQIKASIVTQDEHEQNVRKYLNLGHTFGHAIEKLSTHYLHGEAVSIGLVMACKVSLYFEESIENQQRLLEVQEILSNFGLPTTFDYSPSDFIQAMMKDKKKHGDKVQLVLPSKTEGEAVLQSVNAEQLTGVMNFLQQH